ncbi:DUF808 domain-containing protein [Pseudomonas typographi]|uniref:DUF808 domain-containing protein n=1 Tax=Pseudomonas typographi TaxID=2715964 RepID=A0ABR7Z7T6_9PSED|nr:DUF808 family protein [Pseudomonas typographi]MBD1554370.1 DUF808 domain-containing protein [Pseudomonas typographi]MBD1601487.1 DUF808 domain-containing protein [Pseudomonas typographi]
MAVSSFFALFDDIATLLDDISVMSKVAAKKTASVLTDDLAVNAEKVVELKADRELPVVWAVCKGSLINKAILIPLALGLNYLSPVIVHGLLVIGGIYLCYEGVESLIDKLTPHDKGQADRKVKALNDAEAKAYEAKKVKGAVTTDFILSAEIVVITLNVVAQAPFAQQLITLIIIALLVTFGVYGLVAGIVRLDDLGLRMRKITSRGHFAAALRRVGGWLILMAPKLMKMLSWVGTIAMFFVGGAFIAEAMLKAPTWLLADAFKAYLHGHMVQAVVGLAAGGIAVGLAAVAHRLFRRAGA